MSAYAARVRETLREVAREWSDEEVAQALEAVTEEAIRRRFMEPVAEPEAKLPVETVRIEPGKMGFSRLRPCWVHRGGGLSNVFECSECRQRAYYPQNTRKRGPIEERLTIGYRICPYCRAEMKGILRIE